jgi:predicted acyl esterase
MVSEIRPDGQEQFVADGWLRVSQRKLDGRASTALRPVQTNLESDVQMLDPGVPVFARAQIQPFNHVFRAGSAIRFSIDAPSTSLIGLPSPATNTLQHTPTMPSAVVLGYLPGGTARTTLQACGALLNQPCRATAGTVPPGSLDPGRR